MKLLPKFLTLSAAASFMLLTGCWGLFSCIHVTQSDAQALEYLFAQLDGIDIQCAPYAPNVQECRIYGTDAWRDKVAIQQYDSQSLIVQVYDAPLRSILLERLKNLAQQGYPQTHVNGEFGHFSSHSQEIQINVTPTAAQLELHLPH